MTTGPVDNNRRNPQAKNAPTSANAELSTYSQPLLPLPRARDVNISTSCAPTPKIGASRGRDLLFEAVVEVCGVDLKRVTPSFRGGLNRAVAELRSVEASPAEVHLRAANYHSTYPRAALTPNALAKHWPALGRAGARVQPAGFSGIRDFLEANRDH